MTEEITSSELLLCPVYARQTGITDDSTLLGSTLPERTWVLPIPESHVIADDADPAELAAARETIRLAFITALQHLPEKERAAVVLRDIEGLSTAEVAEILGSSEATVRSQISNARLKIKKAVKRGRT